MVEKWESSFEYLLNLPKYRFFKTYLFTQFEGKFYVLVRSKKHAEFDELSMFFVHTLFVWSKRI
jgi:hypothetical protein